MSGKRLKLMYVTTLPVTQLLFLNGQNTYLAERGFELHCVSSPGPELDALSRRDTAHPYPVKISRRIQPISDLLSLLQLYRVFRRVRPDIAHLSTPKAALIGAVAAWLARVPVRIYFVRGVATEAAREPLRSLFRVLERLTARLCNAHLCVAPSLLRFMRSEGILNPEQGRVLASGMSNGIDVNRFNPAVRDQSDSSAAVVGFVGRLARDKGVEDLAAAWRILRDEFPGARLMLVGPWEDENPVRPEIRRQLERDSRVEVTGRVSDVPARLRKISVFAFPSHGTEGFPNAPMEAAACGVPVVATKVVGCVDAVRDGETGMLVPPADPEALAAALRCYLRDPDLRRRHGNAGRTRVIACYRQERIWDAVLAEYVRLAAGLGIVGRSVRTASKTG